MLKCIPFLNTCNRYVDYMDRRHCNLQLVPDEVLRHVRTLEELLLDSNQLADLPRGLYRLVELRKFTASDNELSYIHPDIGYLIKLQELDLSKNDIEEIPENIKYCCNIHILDLSSNPLAKFPDGILQLKNLTHLSLNDISLNRLPNDIGNLNNLQCLELRENFIKYLPSSFTKLTKLLTLDLGSNIIDDLPCVICCLSGLEELLLDSNEIVELSSDIGNLKALTQLDFSENKLETLPDEIGQLQCLTDLYLSHNQLNSLPFDIGSLTSLCILKADQNQIQYLPSSIGNCCSLQELVITENCIEELPPTIKDLINLKNLNADRNKLVSIPEEICSCINLGVITLRENYLTSLPLSIGNLNNLHVLDVANNRLHYLPMSLEKCKLKALWLSENQTQPLMQLQEEIINEATGILGLTCFLLPQIEYLSDVINNKSTNDISTNKTDHCDSFDPKSPTVAFVVADENSDEDNIPNFIRQNTPHPKELKSRHGARNLRKEASTNSIINKDQSTSESMINGLIDNDLNSNKSPINTNEMIPLYYNGLNCKDGSKENDLNKNNITDVDEIDDCREKRVEFAPDVDVFTEKEGKLRRRDTPHHLKNKRITSTTTTANILNPEEKIRSILSRSLIGENCSFDLGIGEVKLKKVNVEIPCSSHIDVHTLIFSVKRDPILGLGMSIAGGLGSTPYRDQDYGLFISKIVGGGAADLAGLMIGDKLIKINESDVTIGEHFMAVEMLRDAGEIVRLEVNRFFEESIEELTIELIKQNRDIPLGFSIMEIKNKHVLISKIADNGLAMKDGRLSVNDRILSVNGMDVSTVGMKNLIEILSEQNSKVNLRISRQKTSSKKAFDLINFDSSACALISENCLISTSSVNTDSTTPSIEIPENFEQISLHKFATSKTNGYRDMTNKDDFINDIILPDILPKSDHFLMNTDNFANTVRPENIISDCVEINDDILTNYVNNVITDDNIKTKEIDFYSNIDSLDKNNVLITPSASSLPSSPSKHSLKLSDSQITSSPMTKTLSNTILDNSINLNKIITNNKNCNINTTFQSALKLIPAQIQTSSSVINQLNITHEPILQNSNDLLKENENTKAKLCSQEFSQNISITSNLTINKIIKQNLDMFTTQNDIYNSKLHSIKENFSNADCKLNDFLTEQNILLNNDKKLSPSLSLEHQNGSQIINKSTKLFTNVLPFNNVFYNLNTSIYKSGDSSPILNTSVNSFQGIDNINSTDLQPVDDTKNDFKVNSINVPMNNIINDDYVKFFNNEDVAYNNVTCKIEDNCCEIVTVYRNNLGLGFSVVGGFDQKSHPFSKNDDPGIFVSKINENGPAYKTNINVGDRIIKINGINVLNVSHKSAVQYLTNSNNPLYLTICHSNSQKSIDEQIKNESLPFSARRNFFEQEIENSKPLQINIAHKN